MQSVHFASLLRPLSNALRMDFIPGIHTRLADASPNKRWPSRENNSLVPGELMMQKARFDTHQCLVLDNSNEASIRRTQCPGDDRQYEHHSGGNVEWIVTQ